MVEITNWSTGVTVLEKNIFSVFSFTQVYGVFSGSVTNASVHVFILNANKKLKWVKYTITLFGQKLVDT